MADSISSRFSFLHQRRYKFFIPFLFAVVIIIYGAGYVYQIYIENNWSSISREYEQELADKLQSRFHSYQQTTVVVLERITRLQEFTSKLQSIDSTFLQSIFELLSEQTKGGLSLELFDAHKRMVAWTGSYGVDVDTANLSSALNSIVLQGPITSYLVTIVPFNVNSTQWYLVGKQLFDVNYPINNRFISNDVFTKTFTHGLSFDVEYIFSSAAKVSNDEKVLSVPMVSLSGNNIGYLYLQRQSLSTYHEEVRSNIDKSISVTLCILFMLLLFALRRFAQTIYPEIVRAILLTVGIWSFRYALLLLNIPNGIYSLTLFDASYFASPFGFGIAQSIGDVCLSAIFLLVNIIIIVVPLMKWLLGKGATKLHSVKKSSTILIIAGCCFLLFLCMRGFVASVNSMVFDSTLSYNNPTFVLPPMELAVMLVSQLCISISLALFCLLLMLCSYLLVSSMVSAKYHSVVKWIFMMAFLIALSLLFGAFSENPLISQTQRIVYVLLLVVATQLFYRWSKESSAVLSFRSILLVICVAVIFLLPILDGNVHDLDHSHVELLSTEILRPVNTWLSVVMQRALDELANTEAANVLSSSDSQAITKLAFTQWAKSILGREGNNCAVVMFDRHGNIVSNFQIGMLPSRLSEPFKDISPLKRYLDIEEKSGSSEKFFLGYSPVFTADGEFIGGVWVELSAGKQSLIVNDATNLLKNYSREHLDQHYRKVNLSEYYQGKLVSTTSQSIPREHLISTQILSQQSSLIWVDETIDNKSYETLYFQDQNTSSQGDIWFAIRMESLDVRWHVYSYLRYVLFYIIVVLIVGILFFIVHILRGKKIAVNFRIKLMLAFMIVSIIPVLVLAYYNRQYAIERNEKAVSDHLSDQTEIVVSTVQQEFGVNVPVELSRIRNEDCVEIANRVNTNFNIYYASTLQASSKPEIFTSELLDNRLSANAYANVILKKKNFYIENQSIGKVPYVVGYRPVMADNGAIIGVISVPTLFQQTEIDEELTNRNVFLFGAYALALLLAIGIGTVFANQISSPITQLTNATKDIALGRWNIHLKSGRKDEIGELETAFEEMAKDLQRSQEHMLKAQREAAWKEMAKQVAHEIKNPLTPIKLSIQHLRRAYQDNVKDFGGVLQQVSATILEQIDALTRIASEFSHFARMPERTLTYCDVHEILGEAKNLFNQETTVVFNKEYKAQKSVILADREELRRAFINIIRNAIQAMNVKGTITLRTTSDIDIIEVAITDTGSGISPEVLHRIFEPNFSTKKDGMGLGLSIVKKTIDDLGGTITIESTPGIGTTVTMKLLLSLEHE